MLFAAAVLMHTLAAPLAPIPTAMPCRQQSSLVQTLRCLHNNNPCNIEAGQPWQGLMSRELMSAEQMIEHRFAVFWSPEWGFRAAAILIHNYARLHGANTVRKIISRLAPPHENATAAYIAAVAIEIGVRPDEVLTLDRQQTFAIIKAITRRETGHWSPEWTDEQLDRGLDLAGIAPEGDPP